MIEIERLARRSKTIPLISLIDIVFQLLIYFMLSTSFTRSESLALALPSAAPSEAESKAAPVSEAKTLHVYIANDGTIYLEQDRKNEQDMAEELHGLLTADPNRGVLILSADKVKVQALVHMMDRIYSAGGKNIAVADWTEDESGPKQSSLSGGRHHG